MAASLSEIRESLKQWLSRQIRIDAWSLDDPQNISTVVNGEHYPANTAIDLPVIDITYERDSYSGYSCTATFPFLLKYRFFKTIPYHSLPRHLGDAILNNLSILAQESNCSINEAVKRVITPEVNGSIVTRMEQESDDSDWLIIIQPEFTLTFKAKLADLGNVQQPDEPVEPFPVQKITIAVNRAVAAFDREDPDTYTLDAEIVIER